MKLKKERESHFEMKMFLILKLCERETSGDGHGGEGSSYPESSKAGDNDWGCGRCKLVQTYTLEQKSANI